MISASPNGPWPPLDDRHSGEMTSSVCYGKSFPTEDGGFSHSKWWENGDVPIKNGDFPIEIVDLPIKHGDFPVRYVNVYQAGYMERKGDFVRKKCWTKTPTFTGRVFIPQLMLM